jgi:hypothetical protein
MKAQIAPMWFANFLEKESEDILAWQLTPTNVV